jgi:hypothetical protein
MIINTLEQMEEIVNNNKTLSWDGWNVVELTKSKSAVFKTDGAYVDGSWYIKNIFSPNRDGWRIPNKYVR